MYSDWQKDWRRKWAFDQEKSSKRQICKGGAVIVWLLHTGSATYRVLDNNLHFLFQKNTVCLCLFVPEWLPLVLSQSTNHGSSCLPRAMWTHSYMEIWTQHVNWYYHSALWLLKMHSELHAQNLPKLQWSGQPTHPTSGLTSSSWPWWPQLHQICTCSRAQSLSQQDSGETMHISWHQNAN